MHKFALVAGLSVAVHASAVEAMTVQEFLTTAARIPRNPLALLRSDTRRLMDEVKDAFETVGEEEGAARSAGRTPPTCLPRDISITPDDILDRFNGIPARRRTVSVTQAIREWMVERHPCPRA